MGGLGNGRRGGRSPPLMIAALIACILVLGFNYWVSSSRNLELQTKLYELEGQVRRGAAERGAVEMKKNEFQEEIQRQKQQISHMESLYKKQLEGAQSTCSQDKVLLQQNVSSSTKTIQEMKVQLNWLNDEMGKLQKDLQKCQANINTLNNKLIYDMTHCQSQVLHQKELCDEEVAAIKLEAQKKMEKLSPGVSTQENTEKGTTKDDGPATTGAVAVKTVNNTASLAQPKEKESPELLTNDIITDKVELSTEKDLSKTESKPAPSAAAVKLDMLPPLDGAVEPQNGKGVTGKQLENNLTEDKDVEVMDVHGEAAQTEEADPVLEGMLTGPVRPDEALTGRKLDEGDEYDIEDQVVGGADLEKQQQSKPPENIDKDMEEELADYNGDDENEGEFEADKQAELAQN